MSIDVATHRLIAVGPEPDFWVHWVVHSTYNANGDVTAQIVKFEASCEIVS